MDFMLNILAKLCWGRAIGVYFSGDRVSISDVGTTVKGLTTLNQQSFEVAGRSLMSVLQEYVKNHGGRGVPVCLGLKPEQTFFMTSGAEYEQEDQIRDKLLDQHGFRSSTERSEVVVDYFKINKTKSTPSQLWSIGVCKKQLAQELHSALGQSGFKNFLLRPTPWAMSVFSVKLPKKSKSWKVFVQIFLNETGGLAVLVVEKNPMCWKRFSFSESESVEKMISAIRSIFIQSAVTLARPAVDGIILRGPNAEQLSQKLYNELGIEVAVADGPGFTDSYCSYSLAMLARPKEEVQFDIFRELRAKPGIMKMFPCKIAAIIVFLAGCMAFMMWEKASRLASDYSSLKKQDSSHKWAVSKSTGDIANGRKALLTETEAVAKFLSTRIVWSDYLRDLPTRLPLNVSLSSIGATCELDQSGKNEGGEKAKRSLTLRGLTLFDKGRAAPEEIEAFLNSLRKVELLKRDFPKVQLAEIKWRKQGKSETAMFTVIALPDKSVKGGGEKSEKGESGG
jgi:Tfp pilus assembly protein PilN